MDRAVSIRRAIPALAGAVAFAVLAALYVGDDHALYRQIISGVGVDVWPYPFLDTDTVLSAVRCLNKGVDAYVTNPCDPLRRQYDYSPLWMVLRVFPMTPAWLTPVGLIVDIAFLLSLLLLPPGRTLGASLIVTLGVLSGGTVFAVERGNNDLVLFALVAAGATLALRRPMLRLAGYALILLAGLLKYYPLAAMIVVCRERLPRFLAIAATSVAITTLFVALTWHDLTRALAIIPTGGYNNHMFGSEIVAGRIADQMIHNPPLKAAIRGGMVLASVLLSLWLGSRPFVLTALDTLTQRERSFLIVGGMMVAGCFFTALNIGYRVVHLLIVLPPLLALARRPNSRVFALAAFSALALLWSIWWRNLILTPPTSYLTWALREAMWWFVVTVLDGCVVGIVRQSPTVADLLAIAGRDRAPRAVG